MHEPFKARIEEELESIERSIDKSTKRLDRGAVERQVGRLPQRNSRAAGAFSITVLDDDAHPSAIRISRRYRADWPPRAHLAEVSTCFLPVRPLDRRGIVGRPTSDSPRRKQPSACTRWIWQSSLVSAPTAGWFEALSLIKVSLCLRRIDAFIVRTFVLSSVATEADLRFDPRAVRLAGRDAGRGCRRGLTGLRGRWPGWGNLLRRGCRAGGHPGESARARSYLRMVLRSTPVRRTMSCWATPRSSSVSIMMRRCGFKMFNPSPLRFQGGEGVPSPCERRSAFAATSDYLGNWRWPPGRFVKPSFGILDSSCARGNGCRHRSRRKRFAVRSKVPAS